MILKIKQWSCSKLKFQGVKQHYLAINVTGLVEPTEPGSVWEKF